MRDRGEDTAATPDLGSICIDASVIEYKRLIDGDEAWPDRRWAIENADVLGHHLNLRLLTAGEVVLYLALPRPPEYVKSLAADDAGTTASMPQPAAQFSTGDAQAGLSDAVNGALALLGERRVKLSCKRTRVVNAIPYRVN